MDRRTERCREEFLSTVDGVNKEEILNEIKDITDDIFSHFITQHAFCTDALDDVSLDEFLHRIYSDWFFLHKNTHNTDISAVRLLSAYNFAPVNLTGSKCHTLIKSGEYDNVLPVSFQYISHLDDKYFIVIKTDKLYNRDFGKLEYNARLYLNIKCEHLLAFAKEFVDKSYSNEFPAILKILNNDYRNDTITIYTDYNFAQSIVDTIHEIKSENPSIFEDIGEVSSLLGKIDEFIGFGEQLDPKATYILSRCKALSAIEKTASTEVLKKNFVRNEEKIIFRTDGSEYTVSEYLSYLIEKNATELIDIRIEELECADRDNYEQLDRLYQLRRNVATRINIPGEVDKLKSSLTRCHDYNLSIPQVGTDDYDYVDKLYDLFASKQDKLFKRPNTQEKKDIINTQVFKITEGFNGVKTREFLETFFKSKLAEIVHDIIEERRDSIRRSYDSPVLINIKQKACERLREILLGIIDDSDEGREYITRCINDYIRILSTSALENVEICIDGTVITIDENINSDIIRLLPNIQAEIANIATNSEFIDNILHLHDINCKNLCLNRKSKNIRKRRKQKTGEEYRYYYNPEGYLSKEFTEKYL